MSDYDSVRQRIISSVFSKLNAAGHQETYVAHVKIWEEVAPEEGGRKPRYIIIARAYGRPLKGVSGHRADRELCLGASDGNGFIHKSKLNSNGTFSVGKTWRLQELRGVEVVNVSIPMETARTLLGHLMLCICSQ